MQLISEHKGSSMERHVITTRDSNVDLYRQSKQQVLELNELHTILN
jgi:hypothetical protein